MLNLDFMIDYDWTLVIDNRHMKIMRVISGIVEKITRHHGPDRYHRVQWPIIFFLKMEIMIPLNRAYKGMMNDDFEWNAASVWIERKIGQKNHSKTRKKVYSTSTFGARPENPAIYWRGRFLIIWYKNKKNYINWSNEKRIQISGLERKSRLHNSYVKKKRDVSTTIPRT